MEKALGGKVMATKYELNMYVRRYCIENGLFSCGSNYQYDTMFATEDLHDKAVMIYVCSKTAKTIAEIESDLKEMSEL